MRTFTFSLLVWLAACAPDLRVDHPFDGQSNDGPLVTSEKLDNGNTLLHVDATSKTSLVYVDLEEGREMKVDEALSTNGWDLTFKRFEIGMNSGEAYPGGEVEVAVVHDTDFDDFTKAPSSGFAKGIGARISEINGVDGWFTYDLVKHVNIFTRTDIFYVVRSSAGTFFKFRMVNYYDAAGTPAAITAEYGPVAAP